MATELELEKMTLEEKLRAMEALWADLSRREESIPVPKWHKDVLDERERLVKEGKARFIDWETAKKQISEAAFGKSKKQKTERRNETRSPRRPKNEPEAKIILADFCFPYFSS